MIKAFTLMELMIVVVLIGILSSIGMIMFGDTKENAKKKVAEVSTSSIHLAQQEYISNNGINLKSFCIFLSMDINVIYNIYNIYSDPGSY